MYRLLRRGLPGRRFGGEWRFLAGEVLGWSGARASQVVGRGQSRDTDPARPVPAPPLVAANGDVAVEHLLAMTGGDGETLLGWVQADRERGLELLRRGLVVAAGCHGGEIPKTLDGDRLAFIHLVERQVGLAVRGGVRVGSLRRLGRWRIASRPPTAGVRGHFDRALRNAGVDPERIHAGAAILPSHREVACAVARGEVDVGLASAAWANRVGLDCVPLCNEAYGLLVRASSLGDPRVVRLCEVAQSAAFRKELGSVFGYQARRAGAISYETVTVARPFVGPPPRSVERTS